MDARMDSRVESAGRMGFFVHRAPMPSIKLYIMVSYLLTLMGVFTLRSTLSGDSELHGQLSDEIRQLDALSESHRELLAESTTARILYYVWSNQLLCWIAVNTYYATLALVGTIIVKKAFGELSRQERAVSRQALLACVVFNLVFLSVVANQSTKVILWMIWFALVAFFTVLNQIVHQRFKYISPSGGFPGTGVFLVSSLVLLSSTAILVSLALNSHQLSVSTLLFLLVDTVLAWLRAGKGVFRCVLASVGISSNTARSLSYTTDMTVGVTTEILQLVHFVHLMFCSPIGFNLTCIFFFYHMKTAYSSIVATLNRYLKHRAIFRHIATRYPRLDQPSDELCIVCWEKLHDARKLECGHAFHDWCLMWWLEQDASCPTCRRFLPSPHEQRPPEGGTTQQPSTTTWHFSGERFRMGGLGGFLRLPSFSIELSHNLGNVIRRDDSQLNTQAEMVREMFPQLSFDVILADLRTSGSSQATIENILEGRVGFVGGTGAAVMGLDESDDELTDDGSVRDSGDDGSGLEDGGRGEETISLGILTGGEGTGRGGVMAQRRREMILKYRKRYIESAKGEDLRRNGIE